MSDVFDPYYRWLGIGSDEQPADHYRLLGIERFESDVSVIEAAADRQSVHLRTFQIGPQAALSERLLSEVAAARACLLDPANKAAYDARLRDAEKGARSPHAAGQAAPSAVGGLGFDSLLAEAEAAPPSQLAPLARRKTISPWLVGGVVVSILVLVVVGLIGAVAWSVHRVRAVVEGPPPGEALLPTVGPDVPLTVPAEQKQPVRRAADLTGTVERSGELPLRLTLKGHTRPVCALAYSPDGKTIVSGSKDGTVRLWKSDTGQMLWARPVHAAEVNGVAFSPDGKTIATVSDDRTVRLLDAADGRELRAMAGHTHGVRAVAFSPDGRRLATAGHDRVIRLWDVASAEPAGEWAGHDGSVMTLAFSRDGHYLASGGLDRTVRVWDAASGRQIQTFAGHERAIRAVAFRMDSKGLVSVGEDGRWIEWNVGDTEPAKVKQDREAALLAVAVHPVGSHLAVAGRGENGVIRVWDLIVGERGETLSGHAGAVGVLVFSPDGKRLASGGYDRMIRVWDVERATR